jgi:hypothetical protein
MHRSLCVLFALAVAACGDSDDFESTPIDTSGVYTVSVTNKANACGYPNWNENESTSGIQLTILQDGKNITGTVDGAVGALVQFLLGASTFQGTVSGNQVNATNFGTKSYTQNACTYTINIVMEGTLDGDALQGVLRYTPKTNESPDCGVLASCESIQEFAGSRPPK